MSDARQVEKPAFHRKITHALTQSQAGRSRFSCSSYTRASTRLIYSCLAIIFQTYNPANVHAHTRSSGAACQPVSYSSLEFPATQRGWAFFRPKRQVACARKGLCSYTKGSKQTNPLAYASNCLVRTMDISVLFVDKIRANDI